MVYVVWRLKRSPWGRQMLAQRADRWAAQSVGIPVLRPRLLAFVISAFFCGVAGSLFAHYILAFSPKAFYFDLTFEVITMLVVGGLGSVTGSVLGAVVIVAISEGLRRVEDATLLYGLGGITLGVFFLAVIIFRPDGIMGQRELSLDGSDASPSETAPQDERRHDPRAGRISAPAYGRSWNSSDSSGSSALTTHSTSPEGYMYVGGRGRSNGSADGSGDAVSGGPSVMTMTCLPPMVAGFCCGSARGRRRM